MAVVAGARTPAAGAVPPRRPGAAAGAVWFRLPRLDRPAPRDAGTGKPESKAGTHADISSKKTSVSRVSERLESCLSVFFRT